MHRCFVLSLMTFTAFSLTKAQDNLTEQYGEVIFCSTLFRHGARTTNSPYPTDPYQLPFWPEGKAQLTKVGRMQEYQLGKYFRNRYDYLIKDKPYRYDFLYMRSSDIDRTLMSAELFLAGFYPPNFKDEIWDADLLWQPIPVHTLPKDTDNMIAMEMPCDKYDLDLSILNASPEFEALFEEHKEIFEYTSTHSGFKMTKDDVFSAFNKLWDVYDDLYIESANNLTLPSWTNTIFPQPLKSVSEFYFSAIAYTKDMQKLKGGPLLKSIVEKMQQKIATPSNLTFAFYSGHDSTVSVLLSALGVFNGLAPPYSASVIIELREKLDSHFVTVLYKNSTADPYLLRIPGCSDPCTLNGFIDATKDVILDNFAEECDIGVVARLLHFSSVNLILIMVAVAVMLGLIIWVGKWRAGKQYYKNYRHIEEDSVLPQSST